MYRFNIIPVASEYQEIHPYSAVNIDNVKINTSVIMMREWVVHPESWQCTKSMHPDSTIISYPSIISNPSLGMYQDIHPNWEIIIEINTSLEMMKDGWFGGFYVFCSFSCPVQSKLNVKGRL